MKVWIENPFDNLPPEGFRPQRYWLMAQAFAQAGHDVTYWTSDFSHSLKARRKLQCELFGSPFALRLVKTEPYFGNVSLARVRSHRRYAEEWLKDARSAAAADGAPDVVIVSIPPLSAPQAAFRLRGEFGCKVVVDVMDAWPQTFRRLLPRPARWLHPLLFAPLGRMAKRAYREADLVTGVCDAYRDMAVSAGAKSYYRAYHGIALAPSDHASLHPELRLVYAGGMGRTYDLETPVRALAQLEGATLAIAGADGEKLNSLRALASSLGCGNRLLTPGYLGAAALERLLRDCDIGIVPIREGSFIGLPYKIADYSAAGLAVASSLKGESAALLSQYGAGVAYEPYDVEGCVAAIHEIADDVHGFRSRARAMAEAEFDAGRIYREYVAVVSRLYKG